MTDVSQTLLTQRIRNRIIENLSCVSKLKNVAQYGAFESINGWDDWVSLPLDTELFKPPVFTKAEIDSIETIARFYNAVCAETKTDIFDEQALRRLNSWVELELASKIGHSLFMQRGKFPEEKEVFSD